VKQELVALFDVELVQSASSVRMWLEMRMVLPIVELF
jgi:hypothetical protein